VPRVPDGQGLPGLSVQPEVTTIVVTAAVIEDNDDMRLLVTRRQPGVHLAGYWEFPGGKCHPGEPLETCLARELREELAVDAIIGAEILTTTHAYPDLAVELHFFRCGLLGTPTPQIGQEMRWVTREELPGMPFPPADSELIQWLTRQRS
jgi:8-oxo-dGTP diphosphatase